MKRGETGLKPSKHFEGWQAICGMCRGTDCEYDSLTLISAIMKHFREKKEVLRDESH